MENDGRRNRREKTGIDDLPDAVLDNILSKLDLPEAVRAGLVAKRWRHCWKFVEVLRFRRDFYQEFIEGTERKLDAVVNSILQRHNGPISKFEINGIHPEDGPNVSFDISECLHILSEKMVEQLYIYASTMSHLELPSEIYNFSSLKDLNLQHCKLGDTETGFNGFPNLGSIRLSDAIVPDSLLRSIVTQSPKIYQIDFEFREDGNPVELLQTAALANLESIYYQCKMCTRPLRLSTCLLNLDSAVLDTELELPGCPSKTPRLDYFSSLLPCITDLTLNDVALNSLADDVVPRTLRSPFRDLEDLSLEINISSGTMLSHAFCIIRNAPLLRVLEFNASLIYPRIIVHLSKMLISSLNLSQVYQDNNDVDIGPAVNVITQQIYLAPLETIHTLSFIDLTNTELELDLVMTVIQICPCLRSVYFKASSISEVEEEEKLHDLLKAIPLPEDASFVFKWAEIEE